MVSSATSTRSEIDHSIWGLYLYVKGRQYKILTIAFRGTARSTSMVTNISPLWFFLLGVSKMTAELKNRYGRNIYEAS